MKLLCKLECSNRLTETNTLLLKVDESSLREWLKTRLSDERFHHSLGAQQKAAELAVRYKLSPEQIESAKTAGLLHDCAKLLSPEELLTYCQSHHMTIPQEEIASPQTMHPFVGAEMVRRELGIYDNEILDAIRYHTTGRAGMSDVEKVVYIADKIEENTRNPLYTQKINALIHAPQNNPLDTVILYILNSTITFLIEKGQIIHPRTIEARNDFIRLSKQRHEPRPQQP